MSAPMLPRRGFLSGLASLPLIGGGVTLIGQPTAVAVPLVNVAAAPILGDPRERARYAWEAFSAAMREITADAHGWHVQGGERRPFRQITSGAWCCLTSTHFEADTEPRCPGFILERTQEVKL